MDSIQVNISIYRSRNSSRACG